MKVTVVYSGVQLFYSRFQTLAVNFREFKWILNSVHVYAWRPREKNERVRQDKKYCVRAERTTSCNVIKTVYVVIVEALSKTICVISVMNDRILIRWVVYFKMHHDCVLFIILCFNVLKFKVFLTVSFFFGGGGYLFNR